MEIVKTGESFTLKDTTDLFEINGNINRDLSGSINVNFSINKKEGDYVGDGHYYKYGESDSTNFGVNCKEEDRTTIIAYADTLIDSILNHFNSFN